MQLRKRSNNVNYVDNVPGSPTTFRPRRSNSSAAAQDVIENSESDEEETTSDEEGSSGLENSDQTIEELPNGKKRALAASGRRGHGGGRDADKGSPLLVYRKRNAATSHNSQDEDEDDGEGGGEGDFVAVDRKRKKRKILSEPRTRLSLRTRRTETVNYKDASSSDEGEHSSKGGGLDGSFKKGGRGHRSSSEMLVDDDDEELPESSKHSSYRKKGASNGKTRRVAAPSVESADSLPAANDADGDADVKCYSRRLKGDVIVVSDDEDDQGAGMGASGKDSGSVHGAPSANGNPTEPEGKNRSDDGQPTISNKDMDDAQDSAAEEANLTAEKPLSKSSSYDVDMFGLLVGEHDYGPVRKRVSKVEKILAVRNRSSGVPIFCVKLQGKSYRSVVNVHEGQLQKHCPQLLRTFLRRMDQLGRMDGHPGDHASSPAFSSKCLKVDRIITREKHNRWTRYFVKWCGLSYSESTWERDEDLADDVDALKRYNSFNRKKKKRHPSGSSSKTFKDGRSLRDYQEEGVAWLADKYQNGVNCILADEMGLGKTIQSVALLETIRLKHGIQGPFLVVAPVSTLGHWQREVESLTEMNCVVYTGNQEDREIIRDYEFKYDSDSRSSDVKFNVLVTSFEMVMKDQNKLAKISWQVIIVDEAHRLKSRESKTALSIKQMDVPKGGLLLLTGTPVQNNTKEIFSLLNLLDSDNFGSEEEFLTKYGDLKNAEQVKDLQDNVLRPRLLRRMKEDVEKTIPLKEETIVWVELTREQRIYYRGIFEKNIGTLLKGSKNNVPNLRNVAMELRKVCNHPLLCDGVEEDLMLKHCGTKSGHVSAKVGTDPDLAHKLLQESSGKMILVDKLLPMLKEAGNRVLIFSQFTMMLDLLEDYLVHKGYTYERIDGKIRGSDRQAAIDRYSAKESDIFVFLLSTRAGGLGITLTAADTCLIYDSDWNPQNDLQAMARCHRIGQTKDVRIYRLITSQTYEQKLFEVSSRKYGLDEAILGNRVGADGDVEQTTNIEALLKHGAYDMVKDDSDAASERFNTQNIHEILEHRTQKRLIGGRGVNTFSVAKFISQPEIEPEHPIDECQQQLGKGAEEFWEEMLPDAVKASKVAGKDKEKELTPRKRVRVDYREDPKSVSDDETYDNMGGSGRESHSEESSVSVESDEDECLDSWSEREIKRLEDRLMVLGRNHSRQVQQEANLDNRSLSQVEQVSEFIIQLCHFLDSNRNTQVSSTSQRSPDMHAKDQNPGEEDKSTVVTEVVSGVKRSEPEEVPDTLPLGCVLVNDYESGVNYRKDGCFLIGDTRRPTPPTCIRKAMKSRTLVDRLAKNASRYLQILHEREILALAISRNDQRYLPPRVPIRSKKIPVWWGTQEDLDLMIGVNRHGHKEFKKVRMDPTLCFAKRLNVIPQPNVHVIDLEGVVQPHGQCIPYVPNPTLDDGGWPVDSVLVARLKKLIQMLPKGTGLLEISKGNPKVEKNCAADTRTSPVEMQKKVNL